VTQAAPEPPVLTYQTLEDLGAQTAAAVLAVWALRAELPTEELVRLLVGVLTNAALQGEAIGRLFGFQAVPVDGRAIVPTDDVPRRPAPEDFIQRVNDAPAPALDIDYVERQAELEERLTKAVTTLLEEIPADSTDTDRVERLATDEPIQAAQRGYQDGLRLQEDPPGGYRRGINPDCCELCFWLWKEGYVYPLSQPMHRHTGCRCVPVPTTDRVGRQPLDKAEQTLLDELYARFNESSGGSTS
jgi:hypothetical protein